MAYKYVGKTCANCLYKQQVLTYYEDEEQDDYALFYNYVNAELEICEKCGYTSYDIEQNPQNLKEVQNTKEYLRAQEFGYIPKEYTEEYDYIFDSYPVNDYEAYAIHQKQNGNLKEYARALFASVIHTQAIITTLTRELTIEGDELTEKETKDYKKIIDILNEEIKNKCKKIIDANVNANALNDKVINLLCLKILQDKSMFDKKYKEIKDKISEKLQNYILEY